MIFVLPILLIVLILLLMINFVRFNSEEKKEKRRYRFWIFVSRTIIITLLVAALTNPFITKRENSDGNPEVTILYDNSTSLSLFKSDVDKVNNLVKQIEKEVPVEVKYIANDVRSPLGDEIFRQLSKKNILLVTDGNNDLDSMSFSDVGAFAEKFNTTIHALKLTSQDKDVSIKIEGPKISIVDTDYNFQLIVKGIEKLVKVQVVIDDKIAFDQLVKEGEEKVKIKKRFNELGQHRVVARVLDKDFFEINNVYYKVVDVVEKPKVLYISDKTSIIDKILQARFYATKESKIPSSLQGYFAVVIDDKMHSITQEEARVLESFVDDGNGLVLFGGLNSFRGPSPIDLLLPVVSGSMQETGTNFNFIFLTDASGYIDTKFTPEEEYAGQMITLLSKRRETVQMEVLSFAHIGMLVHSWGGVDKADAMIKSMIDYQDITTIDGIIWYRPAEIHEGLDLAAQEMRTKQGNNNVIVLSDGAIHEQLLEKGLQSLQVLRDMGVRVHSFNVINTQLDDNALKPTRQLISSEGRGMFMQNAADINKLFEKNLIISNPQHWITADATVNAEILGYNNVIPTASARTLVTTGTGVPIITTNSYNKVVVISTDTGQEWAPELYNKDNIFLVYRSIDWAVGDPNRNKEEYVSVQDAVVNKNTKVQYKTKGKPVSERCNFMIIEDYYECTMVPTKIGFDTVVNTLFAVNYDEEYEQTGFNEASLDKLVKKSKGSYFNQDQVQAIIQQTKNNAKVEILTKKPLDTYLLTAAIALLLLEILIRRIKDKIKQSQMQ
ncbi:VWA domain-containing protein [Candidatus Woesearchaeota archaeon]|nr:VWA domain-containing protein [Candidatus Woesearchaeota archaeon]